ncbi:hypothetical protein JCM3774_002911 [Rhodotorula dairenensis]
MAPRAGSSSGGATELAAALTQEILHELVKDVAIDEYRTAQLRRLNMARPNSVASSHGSDTDTAGRTNGVKRAASSTPSGGAPKPKKPKPIPVGVNGSPVPQIQMQIPHAGSHPLAKTMSLPSSPITPGVSPTPAHITSGRPPPPPPPPAPLGLSAPGMQARKSLPGMNGLPAKSPARSSPLHPLSSPAHHHATAMHPGAQMSPRGQVPPAPALAQQQPPQRNPLNSDRPESDSEDSEDETHSVAAAVLPLQVPQKMPRQGAGAPDMRRSATAATGGPGGSGPLAAQKVPRKAMATPQGRKSVARAVADSGSSDDDASAGSDSE